MRNRAATGGGKEGRETEKTDRWMEVISYILCQLFLCNLSCRGRLGDFPSSSRDFPHWKTENRLLSLNTTVCIPSKL